LGTEWAQTLKGKFDGFFPPRYKKAEILATEVIFMALGNVVKSIGHFGASVVFGAVPAFLGTAALAGAYALGAGLATAAGLGGGLSVIAGMATTVFLGGAGLGIGMVAGGAGLAAVSVLPGVRDARLNGAGVVLGAALGVAGSVGMAHHLVSEVKPPQRASLTESFSKSHMAQAVVVPPGFKAVASLSSPSMG
jgi:hypothetical protein